MATLKICAGQCRLHAAGPWVPCVLFVSYGTVLQAVTHDGEPVFDDAETWEFAELPDHGCFVLNVNT